jgi:hypothetical protein
MTPLFNKQSLLVGWLSDAYDHIFDTRMDWVGYVVFGHVWNVSTGAWVGPFPNGNILNTNGRPICWSNSAKIRGTVKPIRPVKPVRPVKPIKPVRPVKPIKPITPVGGWSNQTFAEAF